jgi:succinylglutamate desuccinylase
MKYNNIAVLGGTHGNEWSGVKVVQDFVPTLLAKTKYPFQIHPMLVNLKAIEAARRFIDFDMNRISAHLKDKTFAHHYEWKRAGEISEFFTAKKIDFIIDMHTTTSNMGVTLIVTHLNASLASICSYVQSHMPDVRVLIAPDPTKKYLVSQVNEGIMIEVGPCMQAINDAKIIQQTAKALELILEAIKIDIEPQVKTIEYFEEKADFFYPEIFMIHPQFQNRDYQFLNANTAIFADIHGKEILSTKEHEGYAIFINEAAYYPSNLAFSVCDKKTYDW